MHVQEKAVPRADISVWVLALSLALLSQQMLFTESRLSALAPRVF